MSFLFGMVLRCLRIRWGRAEEEYVKAGLSRDLVESVAENCKMKIIVSFCLILVLALVTTGCAPNVGVETTAVFDSQTADTTNVGGSESGVSTSAPVTISESATTTMVESGLPTADSIVESTTTTTLNPVDNRPFSQAWIESSSLYETFDLLEGARLQEEYWLNNPNTLSSPMGAFCWAYHEILRAVWRLLKFYVLSSEIELLMDELGITVAQVGEEGPDRNTAVLDIAEGANQDTAPVDSVEGGDIQTGTTQPSHSDEYIEYHRTQNRIGGDGTEWYDALRAVADPKIIEATRSGDGLPTVVQPYADHFFETVNKLSVDTRPVTDYYYYTDFYNAFSEEIPLSSDLVAFLEEAKYSQDCKRVHLAILDYQ